MSLDKAFFEKEIEKRNTEMETICDEVDGLKRLIEAADVNKSRIKIEITLIQSFINVIDQEAVAEEASTAD